MKNNLFFCNRYVLYMHNTVVFFAFLPVFDAKFDLQPAIADEFNVWLVAKR